MSASWFGIAVEGLVATLLAITIAYCAILNVRLRRLRADETQLRQIIFDLVRATEVAERAIIELRHAAQECDKTLSRRLREAEYFSVEIAREIGEGEQVLDRIAQIAKLGRAGGAGARPVSEAAPVVADPAAAGPRLAELRVQFAQSAERLAGLRRGADSEAA